jgi:hypothetical protein
MLSRKLTLALLALISGSASAQIRGASHVSFGPGFASARRHALWLGSLYYGDPFFYDDYPSGSLASAPQNPQVILLQPASATEAPKERPPDPLMIELRGNQYVRVSDGSSAGSNQTPQLSVASVPDRPSVADLPALLIYRDGRREQVDDYAIVGGVIYARGDYWRTGSWTKPIHISVLNIPATIQANQKQGVKFILPSGPNEVVTRP